MNNLLINLTKNVWNMEEMKWVIFIRSCDLNMAATVKERPYVISYGKTVNLLEVYIIVFISKIIVISLGQRFLTGLLIIV